MSRLFDLIYNFVHEEQIQKLEQKERIEKEDKMKEVSSEKSGPEVNFDGQKQPLKITDAENMELSEESPSYQVGYYVN